MEPPFKNVKNILSLQTVPKLAVGWIWPVGHMPTRLSQTEQSSLTLSDLVPILSRRERKGRQTN